MKVAVIHANLAGQGFWGGLLLTRQIAIGLAHKGHEVHAIDMAHDATPSREQLGGISVHHLCAAPLGDGVNPLWNSFPADQDVDTAAAFLRHLAPDVVYGHMIHGQTAIYAAALREGIPVVHHVHDFAYLCGRSFLVDERGRPCPGPVSRGRCEECLQAKARPLIRAGMRLASAPGGDAIVRSLLGRRFGERFRLRHGFGRFQEFSRGYLGGVTRWIATGPAISDVLCRYGVPPDRIALLPHSLPDDRRVNSPPPPPMAGRPLRIGTIGRLSPEKGIDLLATALGRLARTSAREFEWWIISGTIPETTKVELSSLCGLPPSRIRFVEGLRGPALNPIIAKLDVCVIASLWPEIGPLTLLEALAQGVPCICNDLAGHASFIEEGVNGFLFRTGDGSALESRLHLFLNDDTLAARMRHISGKIMGFDCYIGRIEEILSGHADRT